MYGSLTREVSRNRSRAVALISACRPQNYKRTIAAIPVSERYSKGYTNPCYSETMTDPDSETSASVSGGMIDVEPFSSRMAGPVTVSPGPSAFRS